MPFSYSAYGLHLRSNLSIARLNEAPAIFPADLQVFLDESPPWFSESVKKTEEVVFVTPGREPNGKPPATFLKSSARSYSRIVYGEGAEFIVDGHGTEIWGTWAANLTLEDALVYLLGPIMAFTLRQRGLTCLHASAVAVGNEAIALVGSAGAGKSTTAASFSQLGYPVVADDVVPLLDHGDNFSVPPGYPCVCLWPESVEILFGSPESLPALTPNWAKRYLPLDKQAHRFQRDPLPLSAIYLLGDRKAGQDRPLAEAAAGADDFISLLGNTFMNYLLDSEGRAREFELLGRLQKAVPIRRAQSHTDTAYLHELCKVIVDDFQGLRFRERASSPSGGGRRA